MAAVLALAAALLFAAGTVLWQRGTLQTEAKASEARFYLQILSRPAWLAGTALTVLGGLCQIAALSEGPIVVVQPVIMLSLVFALPFGVWLSGQRAGRREVIGALVVVGGLTVFLALSAPRGGVTTPSPDRWAISAALVGVAMAIVTLSARGRSPAVVAGLLGTAAGLAFGYQAALVKLFANQIDQGLVAILQRWSTYVLIVLAVGGGALQQASLKTGVLAPAMATVNVATLLMSVVVGIWVFEERVKAGGGALVWDVLALGVTAAGVVMLTVWRTPSSSSPAAPGVASPAGPT
jgi:drug/metabolite transporter (DMT)-like permease